MPILSPKCHFVERLINVKHDYFNTKGENNRSSIVYICKIHSYIINLNSKNCILMTLPRTPL